VLLILAGVTISFLTGNNGILNKAAKAKAETIIANAREEIEIAWTSSIMDYYDAMDSGDNFDKSEFFSKDRLNNSIQSGVIDSVDFSEDGDSVIIFVDSQQKTKYKFVVDVNGKVSLDGEENIVDENINNNDATEKIIKLKVGDYVDYTPDEALKYVCDANYVGVDSNNAISQSEVEKWRVFSVKNGKVLLISEAPTKSEITLSSYNGYNNGVWVLNDLCDSLWSKSGVGKARSINVEDINSVSSYNISKFTNGIFTYGDTTTYTDKDYNKYPNLYAYEKGNGGSIEISESLLNEDGTFQSIDGYSSADDGLNVTQTHYIYSSANVVNEILRNMIFQSKSYWTASRYVDAYKDFASFGLHIVDNVSMNGCIMFYDLNNTLTSSYSVRPIVELSSNVTVDTTSGDGTDVSPYQLKY